MINDFVTISEGRNKTISLVWGSKIYLLDSEMLYSIVFYTSIKRIYKLMTHTEFAQSIKKIGKLEANFAK